MTKNYRSRITLTVLALIATPVFVFAQNGGAADGSVAPEPRPADSTNGQAVNPVPAPVDATGSAQQLSPTPAPTDPVQPAASTTPAPVGSSTPTAATIPTTPAHAGTPLGGGGQPVPVTTQAPEAASVSLADANMETLPAESGTNPWLWPILGFLTLIPFGFLIAGWMKKKPTQPDDDSGNRCFDIKQMMEEKLKELVDVQALVKENAIEKGKDVVRDAVTGSTTGDLLVRAQKLEEQYKKIKALYEECQIDIDNYAYKAVLIENSLLDKEILRHVRVLSSKSVADRVVHEIRLSKSQIEDIQKHIVNMKWFFHVWSPGKDDVMVVFKDKIFNIKRSEEARWQPAILYGMEQGIPREELSFHIE